ncbi:hypothetical protein [Amantichitinum ursilacus]|uniref:HMA domain-containing protein n=1 Tax=Amantichitinum ursilacus TaxID=857265 RepID=A0A0N0GPA3_9NEIS|nr:hypothetical protein [Amantichitinum ursilacus]KPC53557.1 hypothetical protein WG78_08550 [Amantichitinum ursilacus]
MARVKKTDPATSPPLWQVRRVLALGRALSDEQRTRLNELGTQEGVLQIEPVHGGRVAVTYDVRVWQYSRLLNWLQAKATGFSRWRAGWYDNQDSNLAAQSTLKAAACCNTPPRA